MKKYFFILAVIVVSSCNNSKKEEHKQTVQKKELQAFFDSDQIDHYYLDSSEREFEHLAKDNDTQTEKKKEFSGFFYGNYPETIPKKNFENLLLKYNYRKSSLSFKQQKQIENVFSEKDSLKNDACSCIAEYRDIFIFKKDKKTIGIAKICFKNARFQIVGSKIDSEGFGLISELDKLESVVRHDKEKP